MSHTPGPWSYSAEGNYMRIYLHGLGRKDKVKGGDSLCGWCGEANARLIAAAPEMLEALVEVKGELENHPYCPLCGNIQENHRHNCVARLIQAALKKARGEE
jgi:hypothetical protein